jgi:Tol biopolymer transport system component
VIPPTGTATFHGRNGPIAFRSDATNAGAHSSHAIWQVAPDGSGVERITRGTYPAGLEVDYSPVFFPDGRRFVYVRQIADRNFAVENQIYVKSVSAPANALGVPVLPAPVDYKILALSISPDGHRLVLAASPPPLSETQIFTVGLDGGEMTQLTFDSIPARTPEFSSDGRRIAFAKRSRDRGGIFTMKTDGSDLRRLTRNPADGAPSYSPSGERIVFNGHSGGHIRIFSIRADGGGLTQLTHGPFVDRGPVFSPDGRSIVFSGRAGDGTQIST